ncbi:hypothetical protein J1N35_029406 [Gossypium stocksii]|uniref:Uncharacterized protein n=1 Tax=Gossypium stocksii TaxID=47602 RepID=A0A9D3ZTR7_9ROSI|nr:hypothetical protein J1N35_029406 [Gossypium stocksii]
MSAWPRYPPCGFGDCSTIPCCAHERNKFFWVELLGTNGEAAKAIIERENPKAAAVIYKHKSPPGPQPDDFCCNRVALYVDDNGNLTNVPFLG